ncbi:ATP-binding cassette domain-containing protein [Chryseobacterium sp. 1B4]
MITIKDLFFNYDRKQVLKDVTLEYEPGKIYYLLGPNGFGKSTLLRCIAGLHRIEQGSIWVNNENPFKRNINFLNDISYISEETYYPDMSINKFAALYGALYPRFSLQNFHEYLMMFEVEINQRISALSFGQKRNCI